MIRSNVAQSTKGTNARRAIPAVWAAAAALCVVVPAAARPLPAQPSAEQKVTKETIERGLKMLEQIRKDVRQYYYDSTFHGVDIEARYRAADSSLRAARTNNHVFAAIAQFLFELRDSHTTFFPPSHVADVDYGLQMRLVGDSCFIVRVRRGTDAEAKGVKVGDAVLGFDAFTLDRQNFWVVGYVYNTLSPRTMVRLKLRSPGAEPRQVDVAAKVTMGERVIDLTNQSTVSRLINEYEAWQRTPHHYYREIGDVLVWRMPQFAYADQPGIDEMMKRAKAHRALVLDLRGNHGGAVKTMQYFVGGFFDRDVRIGTLRSRSGESPLVAAARDKEPFRGLTVILVNSASASAAEVTARAMQLEGRAIIVGDRSMGAVVTSRYYLHEVGFGRQVSYGASIAVSDLVMSDGQRLENVGVTPDSLVLPTGADLAARRDPTMARALAIVGVRVTPEDAALLFVKKGGK